VKGNQREIAVLLGLIAKDRFTVFNEVLKKQFENCSDWAIVNTYKNNVIRIW